MTYSIQQVSKMSGVSSRTLRWYDEKGLLKPAHIAENGNRHWETGKFDKVLFSYHGIPERHIINDCDNGHCKLDNNCCSTYSSKNTLCYRAQCFETTRLVAEAMNLKEGEFEMAFQSRLETQKC